jgi:hypothetical protein
MHLQTLAISWKHLECRMYLQQTADRQFIRRMMSLFFRTSCTFRENYKILWGHILNPEQFDFDETEPTQKRTVKEHTAYPEMLHWNCHTVRKFWLAPSRRRFWVHTGSSDSLCITLRTELYVVLRKGSRKRRFTTDGPQPHYRPHEGHCTVGSLGTG